MNDVPIDNIVSEHNYAINLPQLQNNVDFSAVERRNDLVERRNRQAQIMKERRANESFSARQERRQHNALCQHILRRDFNAIH